MLMASMIFEDLQPTKRLSANRFHAVLGLLGLFTPDNVIVMGGSPLLLHPHLGTISIVLVCYPISTVTTKCWLIKLFGVSSKKTNQYFHVIMESFNCSYSVLIAIFKSSPDLGKAMMMPGFKRKQDFPAIQLAHQKNLNYKSVLCQKFKAFGSCPYGDACTFAHGDAELSQNKRIKI